MDARQPKNAAGLYDTLHKQEDIISPSDFESSNKGQSSSEVRGYSPKTRATFNSSSPPSPPPERAGQALVFPAFKNIPAKRHDYHTQRTLLERHYFPEANSSAQSNARTIHSNPQRDPLPGVQPQQWQRQKSFPPQNHSPHHSPERRQRTLPQSQSHSHPSPPSSHQHLQNKRNYPPLSNRSPERSRVGGYRGEQSHSHPFRFDQSPEKERRRRQGVDQVHPQGRQGVDQVHPQGRRGDDQVHPQGRRGDDQVRPQGRRGDDQVHPQGEHGENYSPERMRRASSYHQRDESIFHHSPTTNIT